MGYYLLEAAAAAAPARFRDVPGRENPAEYETRRGVFGAWKRTIILNAITVITRSRAKKHRRTPSDDGCAHTWRDIISCVLTPLVRRNDNSNNNNNHHIIRTVPWNDDDGMTVYARQYTGILSYSWGRREGRTFPRSSVDVFRTRCYKTVRVSHPQSPTPNKKESRVKSVLYVFVL